MMMLCKVLTALTVVSTTSSTLASEVTSPVSTRKYSETSLPSNPVDFHRQVAEKGGFVYTCLDCVDSHRTIVYKRLTPEPEPWSGFSYYDLVFNTWRDFGNDLNKDFALYSSVEDAVADKNRWQYCNYNDPGVGFPRDCGPRSKTNFQWLSIDSTKRFYRERRKDWTIRVVDFREEEPELTLDPTDSDDKLDCGQVHLLVHCDNELELYLEHGGVLTKHATSNKWWEPTRDYIERTTRETKYIAVCKDEGVVGGFLASLQTRKGNVAVNQQLFSLGLVKVLSNVDEHGNTAGAVDTHDLVFNNWRDENLAWKNKITGYGADHMPYDSEWIWKNKQIKNTMTFEIQVGQIACGPTPVSLSSQPATRPSGEEPTLPPSGEEPTLPFEPLPIENPESLQTSELLRIVEIYTDKWYSTTVAALLVVVALLFTLIIFLISRLFSRDRVLVEQHAVAPSFAAKSGTQDVKLDSPEAFVC